MHHSSQKHEFYSSSHRGHRENPCFSENATSTFNSTKETEQTKLKAKAYINPQIINYEYVKRSLGQSNSSKPNKIYFNPNFRSGINVLQKGNDMQLISKPEEYSTRINGIKQEKNTLGSSLPKDCMNTHFMKSASRYKLINNIRNIHYVNQSLYSWSKEDKNAFNNPSQMTHEMGISKINKPVKITNNKLENANCFKLNISKNGPKVPDSINKFQENKIPLKYLSKTKIINLNSKKLINNISPKCKSNLKHLKLFSPNEMCMNPSKFIYNKNKSIQGNALVIKNKYKYCRIASYSKTSRFKMDKRSKDSEHFNKKQTRNKVNDIRKLFPMTSYHKAKYFNSNLYFNPQYYSGSVQRNSLLWRRNQPQENAIRSKTSLYSNKKIVKIGGIMYKSTSKKLIIANGTKKEKIDQQNKKINVTKKKINKYHIVYIRGEKYLLDKNGKTFKRQTNNVESDNVSSTFKRLDIGGVTYLQKSQNVLIRTNMHQARHIVNHAKQKSIATLCHLKKRSSLPCVIYHKFGKCIRHDKGLCMYKHDPKNIAICKKFLKGNCTNSNCLLSHETIKEKMATCHFFLSGCCNRENCLFLHVKLNKNAGICENFLHGFCDLGQNCQKRHLFQCPEYDKNRKCALGKKCLYPHVENTESVTSLCETDEKSNAVNENFKYCNKKFCPISQNTTQKKGNRSFLRMKDCLTLNNAKKIKKSKRKSCPSGSSDQIMDNVECVPKRIKLDKLPSFIPLQ